jgi:hypothetical protein
MDFLSFSDLRGLFINIDELQKKLRIESISKLGIRTDSDKQQIVHQTLENIRIKTVHYHIEISNLFRLMINIFFPNQEYSSQILKQNKWRSIHLNSKTLEFLITETTRLLQREESRDTRLYEEANKYFTKHFRQDLSLRSRSQYYPQTYEVFPFSIGKNNYIFFENNIEAREKQSEYEKLFNYLKLIDDKLIKNYNDLLLSNLKLLKEGKYDLNSFQLSDEIISQVYQLIINQKLIDQQSQRLIGSGSFGNVYQVRQDPNLIRKQFNSKKNFDQSKENQDILNGLDAQRRYLGSKMIDMKMVPIQQIQQTQSQQIKEHYKYSMIMINQGQDLKKLKVTPENERQVLRAILDLIHAIILLSDHGYVHLDIALRNICFKKVGDEIIMKLIDYDFLTSDDFEKKIFNPNELPPELWYNNPIDRLVGPLYELYELLMKSEFISEPFYVKEDRVTNILQIDYLLKFLEKIGINVFKYRRYSWIDTCIQTIKNIRKSPLKKIDKNKIDIFSLGMVLLQLFYSGNYNFSDHSKRVFKSVIERMIDPNFETRISPHEAFERWQHNLALL